MANNNNYTTISRIYLCGVFITEGTVSTLMLKTIITNEIKQSTARAHNYKGSS